MRYGFEIEKEKRSDALMKQVHGSGVVTWKKGMSQAEGDAIYTFEKDVPIYVYTADCLPLLVLAEGGKNPGVAAIHAGWRGAMKGVVKNTLQTLIAEGAHSFRIVVGPHIHACCFEVKEDFIDTLGKARGDISDCVKIRNGKTFFELLYFVKSRELSQFEVTEINEKDNRCTYCSTPYLPSYRRSGGALERIRSWIEVTH
jgi:YfiH family protein